MRRINGFVAVLALVSAVVCLGSQPADRDPVLTGCRDALLAQVESLRTALPEMTRAADIAADRLMAGGALYAAGQEAFMSEAGQRAGGLMMLDPLTATTSLSAKDVLLVGAPTNRDEAALAACRRGKEAGAHVVLFSPAFEEPEPPLARLCGAHVVNFASNAAGAGLETDGKRALPLSSLMNVTALWTYTGELVGALTRKGKTPVLYQTSMAGGGRERNAKYNVKEEPSRRRFHDDLSVPPQAEGQLGGLYLDTVRRQICGLRGPMLEQLAGAAALMADAARAGQAVRIETVSHFTRYEVVSADVPAWARVSKRTGRPDALAATKPGNVYFELGYFDLRPPFVEAARKADGKSVVALCHAPAAPLAGPQPDMLIDSQWDYGDAAICLPGYDTRILPTSAVLQCAVFWTVMAKAEELRAR